ncbi:MAG: helix-turn-helix domain-containing protein [Candidatus Thorarchaeota archaeon]
MSGEKDSVDLEPDLRGNTLRIYWYMLTQGEAVGVREVQRALGLSSPSVASHHLSKLVDMELIEKRTDNMYELMRIVKVGVLRNFIAFRGTILPRYAFVAMFFTAYSLAFLAISASLVPGIFDRYIALAVGVIGALFAWYETYRLWKLKLT